MQVFIDDMFAGWTPKTDAEEHCEVRSPRLRHHPSEGVPQGETKVSHLATRGGLWYVYALLRVKKLKQLLFAF